MSVFRANQDDTVILLPAFPLLTGRIMHSNLLWFLLFDFPNVPD